MRANTALVIEPAASWRRLQQSSEFFFEDLDAQMKEHHREFLEALMGYERQGFLNARPYERTDRRLNVFPVQAAPLRERRDDIPLLAQHFIKQSVKELGCAKPRLTRAGIIQLQSYDWPGNVRELRNVIERAVILARGGTLEFELPTGQTQPAASSVKSRVENTTGEEFMTEAEIRQHERDNLVMVLEKAQWKIKGPNGAAELLGISPGTLTARIRKMGLKRAALPEPNNRPTAWVLSCQPISSYEA